MATIYLTNLTVPTPTPYSAEDPLKNLGDLCYVLLQIAQQAQQAQFEISDQGAANLLEIKSAVDALAYNGQVLDMGDLKLILTGKLPIILGL
jgi:hypothetical protein